MTDFTCIACQSPRLHRLDDRWLPVGVTSDCKPWPRCGEFYGCAVCGHVQKRQDAVWQADIARIYNDYQMYTLSDGNEQVIFSAGVSAPRTKRLLELFTQKVHLSEHGDWLDIGCGNGSTLGTFAGLKPTWRLAGYDVHNRFESAVRAIPTVNGFYHGSLESIDRQFDVVSLVYVIEHIPQPLEALKQMERLLKPDGILFLHTANLWDNPFDLAVVDHCSHFRADTMAGMTWRAGFDVIDSNDNWIAKEIGVIARRGKGKPPPLGHSVAEIHAGANARMSWLGTIVAEARAAGAIGIFGTAIAGTWLASMVPDCVRFFVDEDQQRSGKTHLGAPVFTPENAPAGVPIVVAFPPHVAASIKTRLAARHPHLALHTPPPYPRLRLAA
jgi:2-polyprenyl-3-methyl-5-hydroxy-6-metoxy-1,4-benzoquinol methylase